MSEFKNNFKGIKSLYPKDARAIKNILNKYKDNNIFKIQYTNFKSFVANAEQWSVYDDHLVRSIHGEKFNHMIRDQIMSLFPVRSSLFVYETIRELDKSNNDIIQDYLDPSRLVNDNILKKVCAEVNLHIGKHSLVNGYNVYRLLNSEHSNNIVGCNSLFVLLEKLIMPIKVLLLPNGSEKYTPGWKLFLNIMGYIKVTFDEDVKEIKGDMNYYYSLVEESLLYNKTNNQDLFELNYMDDSFINGVSRWKIVLEDTMNKLTNIGSKEYEKISKSVPRNFKCIKKIEDEGSIYIINPVF